MQQYIFYFGFVSLTTSLTSKNILHDKHCSFIWVIFSIGEFVLF